MGDTNNDNRVLIMTMMVVMLIGVDHMPDTAKYLTSVILELLFAKWENGN